MTKKISLYLPRKIKFFKAADSWPLSRFQPASLNENNRFIVARELNCITCKDSPGPFWGCPVSEATLLLRTRSPGFSYGVSTRVQLHRLRIVEQRLPGVQECWKLSYPGSVGSQALVGIPCVHNLRRHPQLVQISRVWPFETQFTSTPCPNKGPFILHAEIWPGVVNSRVQELMRKEPGLIRDQAQVRAMCKWAAELDQQGGFGRLFDVPDGLNQEQIRICIEEEGWILGAK